VTWPDALTVHTDVVEDEYELNEPTDVVSSAVTFVVAPIANGASPYVLLCVGKEIVWFPVMRIDRVFAGETALAESVTVTANV
jgi:endonuclease/exonuclease/phosphatase family metal-dependent hydrolase